jgi:hypothetical protein
VYRDSLWINGATCSGKTNRLIQQLQTWAETPSIQRHRPLSTFLVFAATGDNRLDLADRMAIETQGHYRIDSATPLGFFQDEVTLFLPLIAKTLNLKVQFPLRLRPETEQQLATQLWQPLLEQGRLRQSGVQDYFAVRRTLDLLQLAAASGVPHEEIPAMLNQGFGEAQGSLDLWEAMGEALSQWWRWCIDRGLLTYGIITELYWRYLLPNPTYHQHLKRRYCAVLADDVDEYPAITRLLFEVFLDNEIPVLFTFNPNGGVRVGLGADPTSLASLADRCQQVETLTQPPDRSVGATWGDSLVAWIREPMILPQLPEAIQTLQTTSRADLLRQTAQVIVDAVQSGQVQPQEIAVIAPGLDAIARYTLREILSSRGIPVLSLNDQHPLVSSPLVRALLTLLALVYPGLGRLLNRETIAEMLVLLSAGLGRNQGFSYGDAARSGDREAREPSAGFSSGSSPSVPALKFPTSDRPPISTFPIDPVRAGLLTDHCFVPDPEHPHLLPATAFPRWDRLGHQAVDAYRELLQWIEAQKEQQRQRLIPSPVVLLDRAIQHFLYGGSHLPYDQLAALRELMETAQHYWEVESRLQHHRTSNLGAAAAVEQFIHLLREGTITADPYPVRPMGKANQAVTLATAYQYRSDRRFHRWQFWLDAGSPFWLTGGAVLFGAPLFLQDWNGRPWTAADTLAADQRRLEKQILDLLCRAAERIYLCYSELATNGQEQTGTLLSLVNAASPILTAEQAETVFPSAF